MKSKNYFITFIDYSVPEWQEIGTQAFFACLIGFVLSVVLYLAVYYA